MSEASAYHAYLEQYGYSPQQPKHLISFAKSRNIKISYKNAREIISNPPPLPTQTNTTTECAEIEEEEEYKSEEKPLKKHTKLPPPIPRSANSFVPATHNLLRSPEGEKLRRKTPPPPPVPLRKTNINLETNAAANCKPSTNTTNQEQPQNEPSHEDTSIDVSICNNSDAHSEHPIIHNCNQQKFEQDRLIKSISPPIKFHNHIRHKLSINMSRHSSLSQPQLLESPDSNSTPSASTSTTVSNSGIEMETNPYDTASTSDPHTIKESAKWIRAQQRASSSTNSSTSTDYDKRRGFGLLLNVMGILLCLISITFGIWMCLMFEFDTNMPSNICMLIIAFLSLLINVVETECGDFEFLKIGLLMFSCIWWFRDHMFCVHYYERIASTILVVINVIIWMLLFYIELGHFLDQEQSKHGIDFFTLLLIGKVVVHCIGMIFSVVSFLNKMVIKRWIVCRIAGLVTFGTMGLATMVIVYRS